MKVYSRARIIYLPSNAQQTKTAYNHTGNFTHPHGNNTDVFTITEVHNKTEHFGSLWSPHHYMMISSVSLKKTALYSGTFAQL